MDRSILHLDEEIEEIQFNINVHQHRKPKWNENLPISMSEGLLLSIHRWILK